jgi:hypothetical protein
LLAPSPANCYHVEHAERLRRTFHALTGRDLIDPTLSPEAAAEALFHAPFAVLSGTLYVGFGETFDETKVVAIPSGAVYVAPAEVPHYIWAKEGEVWYQETGRGPTETVFIPAGSPPEWNRCCPSLAPPTATPLNMRNGCAARFTP